MESDFDRDEKQESSSAWPAIGQGCGCFLILVGLGVFMNFALVMATIARFAN